MTSISASLFSPHPFPSFSLASTSPRERLYLCHPTGSRSGRRNKTLQVLCRTAREENLQKLPDKKKPLCSHSLPCIEAWLAKLGFYPSRDDRAIWFAEKPDWHAQLSLDITDLYISLKYGPRNLEKDVERRFSYALRREDIENAILGGP